VRIPSNVSIIATPSQPNISDQFNLTCVVWVNRAVVDISVEVDIQWTAIQPSDRISISNVTRNQHGYRRSLLIREVLVNDSRSYVCNAIISPTLSMGFIEKFVNSSSHELILGITTLIMLTIIKLYTNSSFNFSSSSTNAVW
jgi:hypothetical protein